MSSNLSKKHTRSVKAGISSNMSRTSRDEEAMTHIESASQDPSHDPSRDPSHDQNERKKIGGHETARVS